MKLRRQIVTATARKVGTRVRKYIAPALPFIITPVALGAAISAGAVAFFFQLADDIREQDGVWRFDHDGLRLALSLRNPARTALMHTVSHLVRPDFMTALGFVCLVVAWAVPRYRHRTLTLAVALAGGGGIIGGIKMAYGRQRPSLIDTLAHEGTFSFPSGHAFISITFYGILAYWLQRHRPLLERVAIWLAAGGTVALTGAARVYLGVHYPSDVLAGYATGIPWLTACLIAYDQYERRLQYLPQIQTIEAQEEPDYAENDPATP